MHGLRTVLVFLVTPHLECITRDTHARAYIAVVLHSTSDIRSDTTTAVFRLPIRSSDHPTMVVLIVSVRMLQYSKVDKSTYHMI